jgi:hypothetical protein
VSVPAPTTPTKPRPKRKRAFLLWILLALFLLAILWVVTSSNPLAQALQELGGNKHDQAIIDTPFSVSPHNFRYYKFSLPDGSTNVAIVGDFTASPEMDPHKSATQTRDQAIETGIEVSVLSESAFAIWQKGSNTSSVFESGRVPQGKLHADLPAGAGVYYLVFSNKFDPNTAKRVNANVLLRYKSWLPDWARRMKSDS